MSSMSIKKKASADVLAEILAIRVIATEARLLLKYAPEATANAKNTGIKRKCLVIREKFLWAGNAILPKVTVKYNSTALKEDKDHN